MVFIILRIIAIGFLIGALFRQPYDYYIILRWVVCGVSAYGVFLSNEIRKPTWIWIFSIVALVFNPIFPVHLSRATWAYIDIAAGIIFIGSIILLRKTSGKK